ncbi:tyrosine-protein phosphatase non-receptor type 11-like [Sycon ciliatum]|uniref:tyrosine-protein phosphatase non-receptor type 11-like n=1 Tax=Sycon ciliatum TaxID=27933 RepID=UPI0031F677CC
MPIRYIQNLGGPVYGPSPRCIPISNFPKFVSQNEAKIKREHAEVNRTSPAPAAMVSVRAENLEKNRYKNVLAFDHSRVRLGAGSGGDYINANYIHHPQQHNAYIATQGPLCNTVRDFWQMVYEQGTTVVVMLGENIEHGIPKVFRYWPLFPEEKYTLKLGPLRVRMLIERKTPWGMYRSIRVSAGTKYRDINHYQLTEWADYGAPSDPYLLLRFVLAVRYHSQEGSFDTTSSRPVVVHCSAGVGRTGTFIAVDTVVRELLSSQTTSIDLYGIIRHMRSQRNSMIQGDVQYLYAHKVIALLLNRAAFAKNLSRNALYYKLIGNGNPLR